MGASARGPGKHSSAPPIPPVSPLPAASPAGLFASTLYTIRFARARAARKKAIFELRGAIAERTAELDAALAVLGRQAREVGLRQAPFDGENDSIDSALARRAEAERKAAELAERRLEENRKSAEIDSERQEKLGDAELALKTAKSEQKELQGTRREARDRLADVERRQRALLKEAEKLARGASGGPEDGGNAADERRREVLSLHPEREEAQRRSAALEAELAARSDQIRAQRVELEAAQRSLHDAREGHRHRIAELEAEEGRNHRALLEAQSEIARRQVMLGTLLNLNRVDRPEFAATYAQIDEQRHAIGAQTRAIDQFVAERAAYDRAALLRGTVTIAALALALITVALVLAAFL